MTSQGQFLNQDKSTVRKRCAESICDFSAKLYGHLCNKSDKNIFFSPLSIAACLQMVHHGAKGNTKRQTSDVMGILGIEDADILSFYHDTIASLNSEEDKFTSLDVANRVWIKDNFAVLDAYKQMLQGQLHADIIRNPFTDPDGVSNEVNEWVSKSTKGMIKELITPAMINGLTRLILCNAIYFKGLWTHAFDTSDEEDFHLSAKETKKVQMMRHYKAEKMMYGENGVARYVIIPYKGRKGISMMVILPQVPYQLQEVEKKMTERPGVVNEWFKSASSRNVRLKLPKFKFEEKYDLKQLLEELGVTDMFTVGVADFSGINGDRGLYITQALHKAVIELSEEGTEAAATTAMVANMYCMMPEEEVVEFCADQPFVMVVGGESEESEWETVPLFLGRFSGK
ncbi:leukocyte elastase inhibitor-like isoform X3 [Bolinopsis microptera]|uniref:leukocyte elastase inhibitor-like isoform X3 n=1 Tax=Bolinopsis microptera TaxID=2820187 RepID=UPI003079BA91